MVRKSVSLLVTTVLSFSSLTYSSGASASFQGLGDLPGGIFESRAFAISGNGKVVVGSSSSATSEREQAFIWTAESGMQGLGYLGSQRTRAKDVSYDGSIVVGWSGYLEANPEAFKWTELDGISSLGGSRANAISEDESVVVGCIYEPSPNYEAVRWTEPEGMVGLGGREAYGISANGAVTVGVDGYTTEMEAVFWTEAGNMVSLGLGGTYESAKAASADGSVIVGSGEFEPNSKSQVFRWTLGEGWHLIENLPNGEQGYASDVSAEGTIVVGWNYLQEGGSSAYIWDESNGTRNLQGLLQNDYGLNLTGWRLESVTGMAADNTTFVGYGINPDGHREAWLATIPGPTTCWDHNECAGQPYGDATCDGDIGIMNLADLFALKAYFGRCAPWTAPECCADFTHDGCINLADLYVLKRNFGTSGYTPSTGNQTCPP
ncbi:MAG: PEP-CTERM sorting domain-containing protein [Planctomycetota bacterium]|jgi:probable HAF family extracellular repeat protein